MNKLLLCLLVATSLASSKIILADDVDFFVGLTSFIHSDKSHGESDGVAGIVGLEIQQDWFETIDTSATVVGISNDSFGCPSAALFSEGEAFLTPFFSVALRLGPMWKCIDAQKNYGAAFGTETGLNLHFGKAQISTSVVPDKNPVFTLTALRRF